MSRITHTFFLILSLCIGPTVTIADNTATSEETAGTVLGESSMFTVIIAGHDDSYSSLAARYLGDPMDAWYVRRFNSTQHVSAGDPVVIPRKRTNVRGVHQGKLQTVPVLTYHRFRDKRDRLSVSPEEFREQLSYLRDHGYYVARLSEFEAFLRGEKGLPARTVLIAIDDGYQSTFHIAFPILQEFNMPAVVYVYSDFINGGGLKTRQLQEMMNSGLVAFEAHSKTHSNLGLSDVNESRAEYIARIREEVSAPQVKLGRLLGVSSASFAYPYGASNQIVLDEIQSRGFQTAFTVTRGSVSGFDYPYLLRRSMIYGEYEIEDFVKQLVTSESFEIK